MLEQIGTALRDAPSTLYNGAAGVVSWSSSQVSMITANALPLASKVANTVLSRAGLLTVAGFAGNKFANSDWLSDKIDNSFDFLKNRKERIQQVIKIVSAAAVLVGGVSLLGSVGVPFLPVLV